MAAPAPSDKVKDKEYTNWLKVTLALYYMKSGLHTFIQTEVNCLHQSLKNKIYGGQTVPLPRCSMCNARHLKRDKSTGVWTFQNQCTSYCDVWLHELLKLHVNRKPERIYWDNSDIPSWPFEPWECAKVFMPRGQQPSNVGPAECDAQALLTLLANCTHFHQKLSANGRGLTQRISTIRNNVMHAGEMKLSDGDRKNFILQIIQLLEDPFILKSTKDCKAAVGNICKIDNDSLDVFFNVELQMIALKTAVNEVRQELGMQENRSVDTIDSLKEEFRKLRERSQNVEKQLGDKMDTALQQQEKLSKSMKIMSKSVKKILCVVEKNGAEHQQENNCCRKRKAAQKKGCPSKVQKTQQFRNKEMPWNLTVKDLHKAWKSIADFLLEELAPKNLLPYFEMGGFLSIEESKVMCQLARTEVAKMLLQRIEAHLPAGFLCLLHALHETKQKVIVKQLRLRIKETLKPQGNAVKCKGPDDLCTFLGQLGRELMNAHKERLLANCKLAKLKFHGSTPPDGNCFFHAVADQLSLTGHLIQSAPDLRQELVNFLRNHETIQGPDGVVDLKNSVEKDWTTYCNDMMRDSEWVDATAVFAMAHMLKKDIMVVTSSPEENDHFIQWIVGVPNYKESPLLLGHVYESHYESLETDDDQKTSIPETDGLRLQKRKELSEIKPTEQGKEQSAVKPEEEGIVMKVEVLKDGKQLHRTEYIVGNDFCGGHIVFDYDMQSECLKFKHGSVTVYLRPLSKHAKETLSFFCQHGGMKNFVLDLLKKKNIFSSLPEGEICIKIQVCYGKDLTFEGHVDDSCIEVVQEDSTMHAQEDMLWSCHLTVAVRKNEDDPVIPAEVLKMDTSTLQMYKEALQNGRQKVHNIRVMVVGPYGVGKTTLINRLLGKRVDISERMSTEGIDVHTDCCKVSLKTGEWTTQEKNAEQYSRLQHVVKFLNEHVQKQEASAEREVKNKMDQSTSAKQDIDREVKPISSQPVDSSLIKVETSHDVEHSGSETSNVAIPVSEAESGKSEKNDAVMEILQLVNENFHKLEKSIEEYATLAMWDFAGMYAFYTTHQTFMTSHAIYLLVIDLSQHFTDIIEDEYFLDVEGIKLLKVHDSIEIWLNSIHSCAPSPDAGIPPVILVGTHVDKIPKSNHHEIYERYFREIRTYLKDKPTRFHLIDEDFAIDNTIVDSKLEDLKRKIVEVASQQPYWGEEIPARWLILEQELMRLRAAGVKVVTLRLVEELNRSGSVGIENREELDVFLRFQHDIGTILYFSMEVLKDKIVLDPQWMIDAIKSLITAKMFVLRKTPSVSHKWLEFTQSGKLSPELIDAVWTREQYPDFHDNKEHILLLLEHLNIIAKLRVHSEDEMEIKEDNFLVPCMLRQKTPEEVICPRPDVHMESSSVLCYVFVGKLLPAPIFHRLLAACIAHWPIATKKKEEMQETMIFCGCCVLQLDHYHRLTLYFREYVIFLRVTRMGIKDKTPSSKLCIEVREFITTRLHKIIGYLGQNLKFEHFIQCPEYSGVNIKSLIPVSLLKENVEVRCDFHAYIIESYQLLKYWFEDQEQFGEIDAWTSRRTKGSLPSTSTASVMTEIPIEAKRKHNMLCVTLDGLITKDSLRNIKQIARTYLGSKHLEKVKRMHDFLSALEDKGIIGVGKYDILIQIMKDANVRIGMDEIHKGAKDIKDIMESSIPSKEQSEKPSLNARN